MPANLFSSQNKSSASERHVQYALDSVQYAENIAQSLQCKAKGNLFRYILNTDIAYFGHISPIFIPATPTPPRNPFPLRLLR